MRRTISEMKNNFNGLKSRLGMVKERIGEFEDRSIEIIQTKAKRKKKIFFKQQNVTAYIKNFSN